MKRAVYTFSAALALTYVGIGSAMAQAAPAIDRLTPLQRQQISRDLMPSSSQDFFRTGQANVEQEIRWLARPRLPNETLLKVSDGSQRQPAEQTEKPVRLQREGTK